MTNEKRIKRISVSRLQDTFDYEIEFLGDQGTAILIAPNGYGKTAFLGVITECLQFRLFDAAEYRFDELNVHFEDKTRWLFKTTKYSDEDEPDSRISTREYRMYMRRRERIETYIKFTHFDKKGKEKKESGLFGLDSLPPPLLRRAIESHLPVERVGPNQFLDLQQRDRVSIGVIIDRYRNMLVHDPEFVREFGDLATSFLQDVGSGLNCVFIQTQRLIQFSKPSRSDANSSSKQDEILRQTDHLASLLQTTYASYAATSQDLDRSFPNRLMTRSENPTKYDLDSLRKELAAIEDKRKALTEAGILVDTAEPLVAPKDEFIENVADALDIYVEDSKKKLSTFDDIFEKVAVFRDLMAKKLHPKKLTISRERGAQVRRGEEVIGLEKLSSGEQHEFIMLFRLIFETPKNSLVLIDEPEISLHVSWQLEFMSDLARIQSANAFQCIIATHSPQIIQGADDITFDLSEQVA
jgi:hypothetical protein